MKHLIFILLLGATSSSYAIDYSFKEAPFTITAVLKTGTAKTEVFKINGAALWTESNENYGTTTGQLTIRRRTYTCDDINYAWSDDYYCSFYAPSLLQILDDVSTHDENFNAARDLIERYYNNSYDSFKIPLGQKGQTGESQSTQFLTDPKNSGNRVELTLTTTGMHSL